MRFNLNVLDLRSNLDLESRSRSNLDSRSIGLFYINFNLNTLIVDLIVNRKLYLDSSRL